MRTPKLESRSARTWSCWRSSHARDSPSEQYQPTSPCLPIIRCRSRLAGSRATGRAEAMRSAARREAMTCVQTC
jgi:hypothetical protein